MGPLLVGIDVGTSKIKICLFDSRGKLLRQVSEDSKILITTQGRVEMDLDHLISTIVFLLRQVTLGYETYVKSIGFSVTSPTLVLLDEKLNAIRPGILYLDNRSLEEVDSFVKDLGGADNYFRRVGNNPSPSTCTAALLNWFKKNEPEAWKRTYKIGYLNSFLAAQFAGEVAVDPTIASYSGLLNIANPEVWDEELIQIAKVERDKLPEIRISFHKVGALKSEVAEELGLKADVVVALGSADTAASTFALGLRQHGDVFESMGTSDVLTFCLSKPVFDKAFMNRSHVIPGLWLAHGAMSTTGAAIKWAREKVFPELIDVNDFEKEAETAPAGSDGLIFLPYLAGERSPIFDPKACGLFFGLNLNTTRSRIIRSVYEGAAFGIKQLYSIAQSKWGMTSEFIRCVGGATKSSLAMQVRADVMQVKFKTMEADHASAYGAALLGGMAADIFNDLDEVPYLNTFLKTFCPDSQNEKVYESHFNVYKNLYSNLKDLMHAVHT